MKELMLRLVKDGKIVGYEYRRDGLVNPGASLFAAMNEILPFQTLIQHDTLELGIKHGDEWIFGEYKDIGNGTFIFIEMEPSAPQDIRAIAGTWPDDLDDGFEEAIDELRHGKEKSK